MLLGAAAMAESERFFEQAVFGGESSDLKLNAALYVFINCACDGFRLWPNEQSMTWVQQ